MIPPKTDYGVSQGKAMKSLIEKFKSISKIQWLAVALIVIGLTIMIPKAMGMVDFYKEASYAAKHDFASGNLSPDLIRPWMSLRYIAVAYAVPQLYLYDAADITPRKETSMIALDRLNQQMKLGQVDGQPALMKTIREAILAYRTNPVVTGLLEQHAEDWMTVQYISNSTGVPVEIIFAGIGLPSEGNANKPLGFLSNEMDYSGGPRALVAAVQNVLDIQGVKPSQP
jgi:hypothetical protein